MRSEGSRSIIKARILDPARVNQQCIVPRVIQKVIDLLTPMSDVGSE